MNCKFSFLLLIMSLIICLTKTNASNILVVKVSATKSMENYFRRIVDILLNENHTITYITGYESQDHPNLTRIVLGNQLKRLYGDKFETSNSNVVYSIVKNAPIICNDYLKEPQTQEAIQTKFDLVILMSSYTDCFLSVVHKQKVPFIYASPNVMMEPKSSNMGLLNFPSVTPVKVFKFSYPLSFMGRLVGSISSRVLIIMTYVMTTKMDNICREESLCAEDMPPLTKMQTMASLYFCNSITALEVPVRTTTPNIIYVGGLHIRATKALPKELQDWMDGSGNEGVIYFSLGTASNLSQMKRQYIQILVKVFSTLKQRVIWKWDAEYIYGLSSNVLLAKWLPQQDILAHKKIRLFMTHGGLFSTQEATYYGIPIIGMPLFGDQINNVAEAASEGWAIALHWNQLTESSLTEAINRTLSSDKMKQICKKRSELMRDQVSTPAEKVSYWVNYVIRHDGAHHLRSPFNQLPWYKIHNVDTWAFVLFCMSCILIIVLDVTCNILKFCWQIVSH